MRFTANAARNAARRGLVTLGLVAMTAGGASAQMMFDGNLLYNNNATSTLAGQFTGTAGAGAPACAAGYTAAVLGTSTYTNNRYADPLLPLALYVSGVIPDFRPQGGSPAFAGALTLPNDGFFTQTCYVGAIGPLPEDDWTLGWTYYDSTGAGRQDLHLASMPDPRPLAVYRNINLYSPQTWSADSNYLVGGQLRVKEQSSLTIPAGTVVFGERSTLGTIIIERGGRIFAVGTRTNPIIMTSDDPPGFQIQGAWGGLLINGRAKTNLVNSCAGDSAAAEGGAVGYYGGNDDNDDSGHLEYVRIEHSGKEITPNNELNTFTFCAVGRGTTASHLMAYDGADDSFEWFGGSMDLKYLIGIDGHDDGYDWQMGTRNRSQFVIIRQSPNRTPAGTQNGDKGIEADDNEFDYNATQCSGRSGCVLANVTFLGDKRVGASFPGPAAGVNFRRGTSGTVVNSIVYGFKTGALKVDDDATFQAHCVAMPTPLPVYCTGALGVPVAEGQVFIARSAPNPFRNSVSLSFSLPTSGDVKVEVFGADGRLVKTLHDGDMQAGPHTLTWTLDRGTPSGMYFYRVRAGAAQSTGKIIRID